MTRKWTAILLVCALIGAMLPAYAAPARDIQAEDVELDGLGVIMDIAARAMLGPQWMAVLDGALPGGAKEMEKGAQPDDTMAQRALAYAMPYAAETDVLSLEEAKALAGELFTDCAWQPDGEDHSEGLLKWTKDGVELLPGEDTEDFYLAVYPYSASFDGADVWGKADLYCHFSENMETLEELPEEMVVWLVHMETELRFAPETLFGYTISSVSASPLYQDGDLSAWQLAENTDFEYSLNVPFSLGLADEDPAHMVWQSADGSAVLTIEAKEESLSYDQALSLFMQAHPGQTVAQERMFGDFYLLEEGVFTLVAASEGMPWHYVVTFTFPADRQAEYSLYAEFIRNSLSIWGISNG